MAPRRRSRWLFAVSLALAGGCGEDGKGATDGTGTTAGSTDGATSPTGGGSGSDVRLAALSTYLPLGGEPVGVSRDPLSGGTALTVEVGEDIFPGVYDGDAWVVFADVPEVVYRMHWAYLPDPALPGTAGVQSFMDTATRDVFVGQTYSGRPDVVLTTNPATALALTASAMTPLGLRDELEVYSYNADGWFYASPFDGTNAPLEGATELAGWTLPWADALSNRGLGGSLIDPGQGDDLWLSHLTARPLVPDPVGDELDDPWSFASVVTLAEAAKLTPAPMIEGATTAASGTFAAVAKNGLTVDLRTTAFFAEIAAVLGPGLAPSCSISVLVEPGVQSPIIGFTPTLARLDVAGEVPLDPLCPPDSCDPLACPNGCPTALALPGDRVVDLTYGNPFPIGTELLSVYCSDVTAVLHPLAGTNENLFSEVWAAWPVTEVAQMSIAPPIGAVRDIRIDGAPLAVTDVRTGVGTTPTLSFSPPEIGTPDYYSVQLRTLEDVLDGQGNVLSARRRVASFTTTSTTVTIPEGILEPGSYYHVLVTASVGMKLGAALPYQHQTAGARAPSGLFTP